MSLQTFFYSGQIRRFVTQFMRIMSNFQVEYGSATDGTQSLLRVPVRFGDQSRQASYIQRNASENTIAGNVPMISCYISAVTYDRTRVQDPYFVSKVNIRQREYDAETNSYTQRQGNAYTVERMMPVPYTLTVKADIWTSNLTQQLQMFEQLAVLFNPSMEIQSTDNYIDWTSLSVIELRENQFTSRTIPVGTDDPINVTTFTFDIPIWISPPAKVKKLGVVERIVNSIYDAGGDIDTAIFDPDRLMATRQYLTPLNYGVILVGNQMQLVKYNEPVLPTDDEFTRPYKVGTPDSWPRLIDLYGAICTNGISQIRLGNEDTDVNVIGTVTLHPEDDTIMIFNVDSDTAPANTIAPVDAIIDPTRSGPGAGLPAPVTGTRYLLTEDIGDPINTDGADAWKSTTGTDLVARRYDIIEYDGVAWAVAFSSATGDREYVTNLTTGIQYVWANGSWRKSYEGEYPAGFWQLIL
jgi:hypothetical protein